jgi:ribose 5-phosphate isomerase B
MTANRFRGVRAVVVTDDLTAEICRRHNDANIICLAGRTTPAGDAVRLLRIWLATPFDGGRHGRRVAKIDELSRRFTGDGPEE